jgi:hypothetical protein
MTFLVVSICELPYPNPNPNQRGALLQVNHANDIVTITGYCYSIGNV